MKSLSLLTPLLLMSVLGGKAEVLLNAGESFTYEFSDIPVYYCVSPPQFLTINAHFSFVFDTNTFDAADAVRVEAFETSTNQAPFFSTVVHQSFWGTAVLGEDWQDLQGVLRITMESGSAVLQSIQVGVVNTRPGGGYCAYNTATIPVFRPPTLAFSRSPTNITLRWPAAFSNWVLQASANLGPAADWTAITNAGDNASAGIMITNVTFTSNGFYRLRSP